MLFGYALVVVAMSQQLAIETVRNMSYQKDDHRVLLRRIKGTTPLFYQSKLSCDVDGSPNAYHPDDDRLALDLIESAGGVREGDRPDGKLLVQPSPYVVVWQDGKPYIQPDGEFKGFYVSESAMQNRALPATDPTRYLDARKSQYIVLPGDMAPEATVGDLAIVYDPATKALAAAVYGDIGPTSESGEASLATIQRLGMATNSGKSSPGQLRDDIFFLVFPNTASKLEKSEPWPYRQSVIDVLAGEELAKWGGVARIEAILKQDPQGGSIADNGADRAIYDELAALKKQGFVLAYDFALPIRVGGSSGRLPCAIEIVAAAKSGVQAIQDVVRSVEQSKASASSLDGLPAHLDRLSATFHRFPAASFDATDGVLRETARCSALKERIAKVQQASR